MAINNFDQGTANTELTSTTTTEAQFRDGIRKLTAAVEAIDNAAVSTVAVTQRNNVTPVTASIAADSNTLTLTSNIVIGTADPPTTSDFNTGQIYFRVE